jgi:hypothetical protein
MYSLWLEIAQWYRQDTAKVQVAENTQHCGGYSKKECEKQEKNFRP